LMSAKNQTVSKGSAKIAKLEASFKDQRSS
jgi:hypothetical protein